MKYHPLLWLTLFCLTILSCQDIETYQIIGKTKGIADGTKLYLTTDVKDGVPTDSVYVKNEAFEYVGIADSMHIVMVFSPNDQYAQQLLFAEKDSVINVFLSTDPGLSRVSGTKVNDDFQMISDSVQALNQRLVYGVEKYGDEPTESEKDEIEKFIKEETDKLTALIYKMAEKHIDNEFGYFLTTQPFDFTDEQRMALIDKMPPRFRERSLIKTTVNAIEASAGAGAILPDFTLNDINGRSVSVMSEVSKHKFTIIDFWASWCPPCMAEMPHMVELYNLYKDKGLGIIGISLDKEEQSWKNAVERFNANWTQLSDLKYWDCVPARELGVKAIPFTIVVDQEGKILCEGMVGVELENFLRYLDLDK